MASNNRPLSPHLQVYKPQLTTFMSITHRATGIALAVGTLMLVCWLIAAATGESFDALALFASLQHSAAAHVGVASLPIIAILLAALPDRKATDERSAMRTGISLALVWLLFVMASGAVQTAVIR